MQELNTVEVEIVGGGMRLDEHDKDINVGSQGPVRWYQRVNQFTYGNFGVFLFDQHGSFDISR